MTSDPVISDLVASARAAQHGYEKFDQSQGPVRSQHGQDDGAICSFSTGEFS